MKKHLFIFLLTFNASIVFCQNGSQNYPIENMNLQKACKPDMVFTVVENMPKYIGGYSKLEQDLRSNLILNTGSEEKIFMKILVNCKGESVGYEVNRGKGEVGNLIIKELDKLPNWSPGTQKNNNVDCFVMIVFNVKNGILTIMKNK
jgi:hypothetical protein